VTPAGGYQGPMTYRFRKHAMCGVLMAALATAGCLKNEREAAMDSGATKLTKQAAEKALTDHTLVGVIPHLNINFTLYYAPAGRLIGAITGSIKGHDRGAWRVMDDGKVCLRWSQWEEGRETCRQLWQQGDEYKVFDDKAGRLASVATSKPGNPHKLPLQSDLEKLQGKQALAPMSAQTLRDRLIGNTASGAGPQMKSEALHVFYAPQGRISVSAPAEVIKDRGSYRISDDGEVCSKLSYLNGARERCDTWYESEKGLLVFDPFGTLVHMPTLRSGNPEQLRL